MFQDIFRKKSNGNSQANGQGMGLSSLDPFSKTSFDALLETIEAMEIPELQTARGETGFERDSFPGFASASFSGTSVKLEPLHAQRNEWAAQVAPGPAQHFRSASPVVSSFALSRHTSRLSLDNTTMTPTHNSARATNPHKRVSETGGDDGFPDVPPALSFFQSMQGGPSQPNSYGSLPGGPVMPSSPGSLLPNMMAPALRQGASPMSAPHSPRNSGGNIQGVVGHKLQRLPDSDLSGVEYSVGSKDDPSQQRWLGPPIFPNDAQLPPRATVESLGGFRGSEMQGHCSIESNGTGGYSSGGGNSVQAPGPTDRREKNRVAQRRFRERQRMTVSSLQAELDARDATNERMATHIRALEQANMALTTRLQDYEQVFGPLSSSAQQ